MAPPAGRHGEPNRASCGEAGKHGGGKRDRRSMFGLFAAAFATAPAIVQRADAAGEKKHRLVIHVDQSDIAQMNLALGNASNVLEHSKSRGGGAETRMVT